MNGCSISKATLGRAPGYLQYLRSLNGVSTISATAIAHALSLGEVQVRKDLAAVSGTGKPKVGYDISKLKNDLESCLGCDKCTNAVLVGAGKLGKALLDYDGFEDFGVKIIAGFDSNEKAFQVGKNSKSILPISEMEKYCAQNDVKLGIITVGRGSAQDVCNQMISSGITAIWNFAPCVLTVSPGVLLKQENLALSLAHLNNQIGK